MLTLSDPPDALGSMVGNLNNNYQVDLIWRAHLIGEKHGFSSRRDDPGAACSCMSSITRHTSVA